MGKMTCMLSFLVALSFFLEFSPAWADGNLLLKSCQQAERFLDTNQTPQNADESVAIAYCSGLVDGVFSTMKLYDEMLSIPGVLSGAVPFEKACWPQNITFPQLIRIVVKYLKDHPDRLHWNETDLIMISLRKAFPCK